MTEEEKEQLFAQIDADTQRAIDKMLSERWKLTVDYDDDE
jgi:hypothetical protein